MLGHGQVSIDPVRPTPVERTDLKRYAVYERRVAANFDPTNSSQQRSWKQVGFRFSQDDVFVSLNPGVFERLDSGLPAAESLRNNFSVEQIPKSPCG